MNNTLIVISIIFCPLIALLLLLGIHFNVKAFRNNSALDLRYAEFQDVTAHVNKYIIQEKYYLRRGGANESLSKPKYLYNILVDVNYTVNSNEYNSFGRLAVVKSLAAALDTYKTIPGSPPIFYQQKQGFLRDDFLNLLESFEKKSVSESSAFTIKFLPDTPQLNQLTTIERTSYGSALFFYAGAFIFSLLFLLFCQLSIAKIGTIRFIPLLFCVVPAILFFIIKSLTYNPNITENDFTKLYHNIELGVKETKMQLSKINN
ncbi:MAG: hypothetical protein JW915_01300 [Chitinispirillaceae bacterium]|nr:hypothetical protein [Chitinispirillaceae bacterium]